MRKEKNNIWVRVAHLGGLLVIGALLYAGGSKLITLGNNAIVNTNLNYAYSFNVSCPVSYQEVTSTLIGFERYNSLDGALDPIDPIYASTTMCIAAWVDGYNAAKGQAYSLTN